MKRRRLPLGILVPAALVVLVGTLATLQYRWLGQVGEAERQEMRTSLTRRVSDFSEEFDREITRTYTTFRAIDAASTPAQPESLATAFEAWRAAAPFPHLVKDVYFASEQDGRRALLHYSPELRQLSEVGWPAPLEIVRTRLAPEFTRLPAGTQQRGSTTQVFAMAATPVIAELPGLLIPLAPVVARGGSVDPARAPNPGNTITFLNTMVASLSFKRNHIVVVFDRDVIVNDMLPALADRHFASDRYRVAVVDASAAPLLTRGLATGATIEPSDADLFFPLMTVRTEGEARVALSRTPMMGSVSGDRLMPKVASGEQLPRAVPDSPAPAATGGPDRYSVIIDQRTAAVAERGMATMRMLHPGWQVRVQHAAGSLDVAVAQGRRRNLWLSFGILSVLVASVGLILFNARRSERLAAQQMDFVATVSHELRTPLAVIRSAAQNLAAGVVPDPVQARQYGELIETEGRRLTDMVEQVLEYAGLTDHRRPVAAHPVDVGGLVRDVLAACTPLFDTEGFHVAVEIQGQVPLVMADEDAIRRALNNLVSNALKYGGDGRWLGITVDTVTHRGQQYVQVSVSDKGQGIDPTDLPHVFESFYRGRQAIDRQIHGNGLGLSLVKRIAESHGGRVSVRSSPGEGATFTLQLPATAGDVGPEMVTAPAANGGRPA